MVCGGGFVFDSLHYQVIRCSVVYRFFPWSLEFFPHLCLQSLMLVTALNPVSYFLWPLISFLDLMLTVLNSSGHFQKIGYDNAAAVAKKAHKEGITLKVWIIRSLFMKFIS